MRLNLSGTSRARVFLVTIAGTLFCVAMALFVDSFNFQDMTSAALHRAIATDILLPMALAIPLIYFFASKLRELAIAHEELTVIASTDSLTSVLTRRAFTALVDAYLDKFRDDAERIQGALLVVDADEFKQINDNYGHEVGDRALKVIAASIQNALRDGDIVGRLGGDEFSVFLPGCSPTQALIIAERIRETLRTTNFSMVGKTRNLSISIGGATFTRHTNFVALFSAADERLYRAKAQGRDRVEIRPMPQVAMGI